MPNALFHGLLLSICVEGPVLSHLRPQVSAQVVHVVSDLRHAVEHAVEHARQQPLVLLFDAICGRVGRSSVPAASVQAFLSGLAFSTLEKHASLSKTLFH